VNSAPGAKVYMDSTQIGTTNSAGILQQTGITSGNHLFKVTKSGYNDWMNTIYVQANTVTTIPATLTPVGTNPTPVQGTGKYRDQFEPVQRHGLRRLTSSAGTLRQR